MPGLGRHPRQSGGKYCTSAELHANPAQKIEQRIFLEVFRLPVHGE